MSDKEEKKDIWYFWKVLCQKKLHPDDLTEEDLVGYNVYQMNKILSSINMYLPEVAELTKYDLPKETHYRFLFNLLPKKYLNVEYPKAKKSNDEDSKVVAKYFEFGSRDTKQALQILTETDINNIKKKYGGRIR